MLATVVAPWLEVPDVRTYTVEKTTLEYEFDSKVVKYKGYLLVLSRSNVNRANHIYKTKSEAIEKGKKYEFGIDD
jgi:hypothetical protein